MLGIEGDAVHFKTAGANVVVISVGGDNAGDDGAVGDRHRRISVEPVL